MRFGRRLVCAALLLLTLLSACAHLDLEVTTGPAVPEKLGILLPDTSDPWDQGAAYHAEKTCSELQEAGELEYRLSVVSGANAMIEAAREMVSWGAQGIVVYPKWGGFEDAAQTLLKEGVDVITLCVPVGASGSRHVELDRREAGRQCAGRLAERIPEKGFVLLLQNGKPDDLCSGLEESLADLRPEIHLEVCTLGGDPETAGADFAQLFRMNQPIDGIVAVDDSMALGALEALKQADRSDVQLILSGGGTQKYLQRMQSESSVRLEAARQGPDLIEDAIQNALSQVRGEKVEEIKRVPARWVDSQNCAVFLDEDCPW